MENKEFEVSKKEVPAKVKDLQAHGYYSDTLLLFETISANLEAVRNTICYIHGCEGFAKPVLQIQGIKLAHTYTKIFRAYYEAILGRSKEYGLTQESQFLLHNEVSAQLSTTISFETVYKAPLLGDGRQLLLANKEFPAKYRNCQVPAENYEAYFEVDPKFLCFDDDQAFEITVLWGVERPGKAGRQYLPNFLGPKREIGAPIT